MELRLSLKILCFIIEENIKKNCFVSEMHSVFSLKAYLKDYVNKFYLII